MSAPSHFLDYSAVGIAELLRERLSVPPYQRSYSWYTPEKVPETSPTNQSQVEEFWQDLIRSFSNRESYFLGTIVLSASEAEASRKLVIDGQQRLATTSLLIAAIHDTLTARGESRAADSIRSEYISSYDRIAKEDVPNLVLNSDDRGFYNARIVGLRESVVPNKASQRLILESYEYLKRRVDEFCVTYGQSWDSKLNEFLDWMQRRAQVVSITVSDESDAFTIFETLNDRGADLTTADLLKNYLFKHADSRLDEVRDNWVVTLSNLDSDSSTGNAAFGTFARHFLSSRVGLVRQREVYSGLKRAVFDQSSSVKFAQELKEGSEFYRSIGDPESDFWERFDPSWGMSATVSVLSLLGIERYRPMQLAALSCFDNRELRRFMRSLTNWSVRMLAVGGLGGGVAEAAFCDAAQGIRSGKISNTEDLLAFDKIASLIPSDARFATAFSQWTPTAKHSRYLLQVLEAKCSDNPDSELIVNSNSSEVNLEHVLPKSWSAEEWPEFDADSARQYVGRLGNHCLLSKGRNGRIGNKGWAVKKPILAQSQLVLTREIGFQETWSPESIETRQMELAKLAVAAWPRSIR